MATVILSIGKKRTLTSVPESKVIDSNTFRQITDSNGSFEGSELKKTSWAQ